MTTRRCNGEGSIHRLANGKWLVQIMIGTDDWGKTIRRSKTCASQAEALQWRDKQKKLKMPKIAGNNNITVSDWLDKWLAYRNNNIRQMTYETYKQRVAYIQLSDLGKIKLRKLDRRYIQLCINDMTAYYSATTIQQTFSVLRMACDYALTMQVLSINPCVDQHIKLPKGNKYKANIWSKTELQNFCLAIKGHRYEGAFLLSLLGLRRGEVCGLQVNYVDITNKIVSVHQQYLPYEGGCTMQKSTKTESSTRQVPIDDYTASVLAHTIGNRTTGAIWLTYRHTAMTPMQYYTSFRQILVKNQLPRIRLHDLRHLAATYMLIGGADARTVATVLGHSKVQTTLNVYASTNMTTMRNAIAGILPKKIS